MPTTLWQQPLRRFDKPAQLAEETRARRAVYRPMIEGEDQRPDIPRYDGFAGKHRNPAHAPHAQNGALRRIENRREPVHPKPAEVGNGERAIRIIVNSEFSVPRTLRKRPDLRRNFHDAESIGAPNHRHHQSVRDIDGDSPG